jgi:hypothetical protein
MRCSLVWVLAEDGNDNEDEDVGQDGGANDDVDE